MDWRLTGSFDVPWMHPEGCVISSPLSRRPRLDHRPERKAESKDHATFSTGNAASSVTMEIKARRCAERHKCQSHGQVVCFKEGGNEISEKAAKPNRKITPCFLQETLHNPFPNKTTTLFLYE